MGATDSLKWKVEYDKDEYDPAYNLTCLITLMS